MSTDSDVDRKVDTGDETVETPAQADSDSDAGTMSTARFAAVTVSYTAILGGYAGVAVGLTALASSLGGFPAGAVVGGFFAVLTGFVCLRLTAIAGSAQ